MASKKAAPQEPIHAANTAPFSDWPAPADKIEQARSFLRDCAALKKPTLIVPDKDADGLSAGLVLWRSLVLLGLPEELISVHFLTRGNSLFCDAERSRMEESLRTRINSEEEVAMIVVDQGSRPGRALVRSNDPEGVPAKVSTLIIDHHQATAGPDQSTFLNACNSSPICTSSLLSYLTCYPLHPDIPTSTDWAAIVGIFGDLGQSEIRFGDPKGTWPVTSEMIKLGEAAKKYSKKTIGDAVSLINAPRRTPEFDVQSAWDALFKAKKPADILTNDALLDIRAAVNQEVERCTHAAPKFSKDGRVALLRINSQFQVHPVIATRWAGTLKAKRLEMIMVENQGHHPDPEMTSFSCRICSTLRRLPEDQQPNLRDLLNEYGAMTSDDFLDTVGADFARGHNQATGGIIKLALFEEFAAKGMEIGVPDPDSAIAKKKRKEEELLKGQTSLSSFFGASPKKKTKVV